MERRSVNGQKRVTKQPPRWKEKAVWAGWAMWVERSGRRLATFLFINSIALFIKPHSDKVLRELAMQERIVPLPTLQPVIHRKSVLCTLISQLIYNINSNLEFQFGEYSLQGSKISFVFSEYTVMTPHFLTHAFHYFLADPSLCYNSRSHTTSHGRMGFIRRISNGRGGRRALRLFSAI